MIKKGSSFARLYFLLSLPIALNTYTHDAFITDNSTTEFDIMDDFNPETNTMLDNPNFNAVKAATPEIILDIIEMVGGLDLLQKDFYLHTYQLNRRPILDAPLFVKNMDYCYNDWVVSVQLFYDQTSKANFTSKSSAIGDYIGLNNDNIIESFKLLLDKVRIFEPTFDIPLIDLFELFAQAKVQERRIGAMIQTIRSFNKATLKLCVPFYYFERNFFLTEDEQDKIEALVGATSPEDQEELQKNHLISDKIGLGDIRLAVDFPVFCTSPFNIRLGVQATLPTAFALVKGILGSSFHEKSTRQPRFNFIELFDLGSNQDTRAEAADIAMEFFLGSLDRLAAVLLDTPLGNNGHAGLALYTETVTPLDFFIKRPWAHYVVLKGRMSLEYLFPKKNRRYFVEKSNKAEFAARNFNDTSRATENLSFIEQQFVNKFYPYVIDATVHPGIVFMSTTKATYENRHVAVHVGMDTWAKTPDKLSGIDTSPSLLARIDTKKARGIWAYQNSMFGMVALKTRRPCEDLIIALQGSYTLMNRGIGDQFTIGLTIEKNF